MSIVKIYKAPAGGGSMTREEVDDFLSHSRLILRLATVNQHGDPEMQPVWYHYSNGKLFLMTGQNSRKVKNITRKNRVYFSVDTEVSPYKGAKGKGTASPVTDKSRAITIAEKIGVKYLGDTKNPMAKGLIDAVREGKETVIEIVPEYFSVWDYGKPK